MLIEILIGLVLFALVGITIMTSLAASARSNITNANLTKAESLARSQLEYVQTQPYNGINNGTIHPSAYSYVNLPAGYSFATPQENMATRIAANGNSVTTDDGLQQIIVSVKYNNNTLFTVTGYKVNR